MTTSAHPDLSPDPQEHTMDTTPTDPVEPAAAPRQGSTSPDSSAGPVPGAAWASGATGTTGTTGPSGSTPRWPVRVGTVVWGLVVMAVGVGLLALAAGAVFDVQLAMIVLVAGAGVALLVGSVLSAGRRRG